MIYLSIDKDKLPRPKESMMTAQVRDRIQERIDSWGTGEVITIHDITLDDVNDAYNEATIAADLYEIAMDRDMPRHVIEARREEMCRAADHAEKLQSIYFETMAWEVC
jgi:hypothetical protein